ncbi:MAG TPA: sugar phosphate isomerase/epimerase [Clostridia bacterium]|nr:sugar phosphate isomerase/epimerase [Clostridia bacterium]
MIMPKIGIQLYTLRDYIKTYEDAEKTFEFVKELGTNVIQISGIGPIEPEKVAFLVDKYEMDVCVTHKSFDRMRFDLDNLIEEHKMMHCDCLGIGGMPQEARGSARALRTFIKEANEVGRKMKAQGVQFAYHNHAFEFQAIEGDKTIMDILIEEGDPECFNFIPDVYWIQVGGEDPAQYLKRLKGRVKVCHFKDGNIEDSCPMITELGVGEVDLDACFKACMALDIPYIVYEQDNNFEVDPLKSTEISYQCLEKLVAANS